MDSNLLLFVARKMVTGEPICRAGVETKTENRLMDTAREGEGGTNWESSTETCVLPYAK